MEIKVVIKRTHVFVLIALIFLVGFVIAQTPPNPGHSYNQISGVAPNCVGVSCPELPGSWGAEAITSRYSSRSYVSDGLWDGLNIATHRQINGFCWSDGTNCLVPNNPVTGSILGGGREGLGGLVACSQAWGGATCSGPGLNCPSGSTKRKTGTESVDDGFGGSVVVSWYICVKI